MRSVAFNEVYRDVVRRRGMDPDVVTLSAAEQETIAKAMEKWLKRGWRSEWWPQLMLVEEREYRATYAAGTTYALGAEVYYTDGTDEGYFVSLQGTNVGHTPSFAGATAWWEEAGEDFVCNVEFDQSWETNEIDSLDPAMHVFSEDPRVHADSARVDHCEVLGEELLIRYDAPTTAWLKFRKMPPQMTRVAYVGATTYAADALVYGSDGECYRSLAGSNTGHTPSSSPTWWAVQTFPEMFREYVVAAVHGDYVRDDEERVASLRDAKRELEDLRDRYMVQVSGAVEVSWEG